MRSRRDFLHQSAIAAALCPFRGHLVGLIQRAAPIHPLGAGATANEWPSEPPASCPFPPSDLMTAVYFTGRHREYENADTWYPSWASNGNLYSPFTDGVVGSIKSYSAGTWEVPQGTLIDILQGKVPPHPTTGEAVISGSDPLELQVEAIGTYPGSGKPYAERYPSASLVHNDIWYYGTYAYLKTGIGPQFESVGPFIGFRYSRDYGKTWTDTTHTGSDNLFQESGFAGRKVKMGLPHFVDFGRDMENSPDGKAYLVGHGAQQASEHRPIWIRGDQVYLARVVPSPENINDRAKWEFFAGVNAQDRPLWTGDFEQIRPIVDWPGHTGPVSITYFAPLSRYLLCISCGWPAGRFAFDTYFLESEQITGPWKMIVYMRKFGPRGYFPNFPSKFISDDGSTAWLCFANDTTDGAVAADPRGGRYALCLHEIQFARKNL